MEFFRLAESLGLVASSVAPRVICSGRSNGLNGVDIKTMPAVLAISLRPASMSMGPMDDATFGGRAARGARLREVSLLVLAFSCFGLDMVALAVCSPEEQGLKTARTKYRDGFLISLPFFSFFSHGKGMHRL